MNSTMDYAMAGTTVVSGTVAGTGAVLTAAGFSTTGITASSLATVAQASLVTVAKGSVFATLQSLGASGVFVALGPIGAVGVGIGALYFVSDILF